MVDQHIDYTRVLDICIAMLILMFVTMTSVSGEAGLPSEHKLK